MRPSRPALLCLLLAATGAQAQAPSLQAARCTRRICQTLGLEWRGELASTVGTADPQSKVRTWLQSPVAIRSFAAFINSRFNKVPAANSYEDSVYAATVFILTNQRPWRDLFTGRLHIDGTNRQVRDDPTAPALGYFGSPDWQFRYRGNEPQGLMLSAAYRTMQNVVGLKLVPSPINGEGDNTATGRERAECRGCHFDSAYALDAVAQLLPRRVGVGAGAKVQVVPVTPQQLFGRSIASYEELVATLADSQAFLFWSCRLAFEFTYGRPESACEAPAFDRCVDTLQSTGSMTEALASLLEDPQFCAATEDTP